MRKPRSVGANQGRSNDMQDQNSTIEMVQVNADDLRDVLYKVPVYARHMDAFYRLRQLIPGFDSMREKCHVCGTYRTEYQVCCSGAQGEEVALYRVPHDQRDETFDRIANAVDYAIHGEDLLCVCGTYQSEHKTYGCESFQAVKQ